MLKRNSRLALALHSLGHLASERNTSLTSAQIAEHIGTNAVVVRRVLGKLRVAGLVHSEKGHLGGWRLERDPAEISFADVYIALGEKIIAGEAEPTAIACSTEKAIVGQVNKVLEAVEQDLIKQLRAIPLSEFADHAPHDHAHQHG